MTRTTDQEIQDVSSKRPHVVILGAGASRAAFPNGDKNGKKLPLMNDLVEVLGIRSLLQKAGLSGNVDNFEVLYSSLSKQEKYKSLVVQIEKEIFEYFASMELPSEPTLYDHLILSLREKDLIATFNWDPFLVQAYARNQHFAMLPRICFLHGNVGIGYCDNHNTMIIGTRGGICTKCGEVYKDSPILFPVEEKDYNNHQLIKTSWHDLGNALKQAYALTIFGYGAPSSDVEALNLMKTAWGTPDARYFEEVEIIDVVEEEKLATTWEPFINSHHYQIRNSFYNSYIGTHPRRSCETLFAMFMDVKFCDDRKFPEKADFLGLYNWLQPLVSNE